MTRSGRMFRVLNYNHEGSTLLVRLKNKSALLSAEEGMITDQAEVSIRKFTMSTRWGGYNRMNSTGCT